MPIERIGRIDGKYVGRFSANYYLAFWADSARIRAARVGARAAAPIKIAGRMINRTRFLPPALAIVGLTLAGPAWSDLALNMTPGVTAMSREIYDLHMLTLWICVVIGVGVYGVMVYAILKFRKSKGAVPAKFTHSYTVEVIWTVIPALILVAHGHSRREDADPHAGHARFGAHDQGHGLPVALAVRLHRRRRAVLQHVEARQQRGPQERLGHRSEDPSSTTCSTSTTRSSCPSTRRCACS